jgi:hypothetical protein
VTHLPHEPRGSAPSEVTDWHALLAGETPRLRERRDHRLDPRPPVAGERPSSP